MASGSRRFEGVTISRRIMAGAGKSEERWMSAPIGVLSGKEQRPSRASLDDAVGKVRDPSTLDHPRALQVDRPGP
jgi:hypothetical protein